MMFLLGIAKSKHCYSRGLLCLFGIFILSFLLVLQTTPWYFHFIVSEENFFPRGSETPSMTSTSIAENITRAFENVMEVFPHDTESLRILFTEFNQMTVFDEEIDFQTERERCQRYGFGLYENATKRRRVFYGSLIADDSWHTIGAHAMEEYGIYHSVAFVESNQTHSSGTRARRFFPGSKDLDLLQSGIFGPSSRVTVDFYDDADLREIAGGFIVQNVQRDTIIHRWKKNGMTPEDIGILGDVDEMFTRDFLRAAQICDIPQFRQGQNCKSPKVMASTLVFEGSPECITEERRWYHPDIIIGECVNFIGDEKKHQPVPREFKNSSGLSLEGYGYNGNEHIAHRTMFPLWNGGDFRMRGGGVQYGKADGKPGTQTGFHLHNFFMSRADFAQKYMNRAEFVEDADKKSLRNYNTDDTVLMVLCALNESDSSSNLKRVKGGFNAVDGLLPRAHQLEAYRQARHEEVKRIVIDNEKLFGQ